MCKMNRGLRCPTCGETFTSHTEYAAHVFSCRGRVNWNSGIVAAVLILALFGAVWGSSPVKAQTVPPWTPPATARPIVTPTVTPTPTPAMGGGPTIPDPIMSGHVYLPIIIEDDIVTGCDNCVAVNWCGNGS